MCKTSHSGKAWANKIARASSMILQWYSQRSRLLGVCGSLSKPTMAISFAGFSYKIFDCLQVCFLPQPVLYAHVSYGVGLPWLFTTEIDTVFDKTSGHGPFQVLFQISSSLAVRKADVPYSLPCPGRNTLKGAGTGEEGKSSCRIKYYTNFHYFPDI